MIVEDEELVADQVAYYRARAPRYDEWWQRCGAYDKGPEMAAEWDRQLDQVEEALRAFSVSGNVLELAGGTGWWTERLAQSADHLTVVDSSPEVLEVNRIRTARADVEYVVADLFDVDAREQLRRGLLLVLAVPCSASTVRSLLVDGSVVPLTGWPRVFHRQPQ